MFYILIFVLHIFYKYFKIYFLYNIFIITVKCLSQKMSTPIIEFGSEYIHFCNAKEPIIYNTIISVNLQILNFQLKLLR